MTAPRRRSARAAARAAFTLIEVLLAVTILAMVLGTVGLVLQTAVSGWRVGAELAETERDGDAVMEQLVMALRSAYFPAAGENAWEYGFQHEDDGEEESAKDRISWVKVGASLVGEDSPWAGAAHRVNVFVSDDEDGQGPGLYVSAWQMVGLSEDFDPEEDAEPVLLSDQVVGLDCRMLDPSKAIEPGEPLEWIDEWTESNRIPTFVRVTLALRPVEKGDEPDVLVRLVRIPLGELSWNPVNIRGGGGRQAGFRGGPGGDRFGGGRGGDRFGGGRGGDRFGGGRGGDRFGGGGPGGGPGGGSGGGFGGGVRDRRGGTDRGGSSGGGGPSDRGGGGRRQGGGSGGGSPGLRIEGAGVGGRPR